MGKIRVLFADDDLHSARKSMFHLNEHGFETRSVQNGVDAFKSVVEWKPHFVFIELLLPRMNAIKFLQEVQKSSWENPPKIFVISNHTDRRNIKRCIDSGAIDYLVKPFSKIDLLTRLAFHSQGIAVESPSQQSTGETFEQASRAMHLVSLMLKQAENAASSSDFLFNITQMIATQLKAVRCSIVRIAEDLPNYGTVLVSSDQKDLPKIKINLNKYPEMTYCHRTAKTVAIENIENDATLSAIRHHLENVWFNSLIVCPILCNQSPYGVVSIRFPEERKTISDSDIQFAQVAAQVIGLALSSHLISAIDEAA